MKPLVLDSNLLEWIKESAIIAIQNGGGGGFPQDPFAVLFLEYYDQTFPGFLLNRRCFNDCNEFIVTISIQIPQILLQDFNGCDANLSGNFLG
jgi:hypothetical protein